MKYTLNLKHSVRVRELLEHRFNEQNLQNKDVVEDAMKHGRKIDKAALSRLFKKNQVGRYTLEQKGCLSEESIAWLCVRWGIRGQLKLDLLSYDEETCLDNIKKFNGHDND